MRKVRNMILSLLVLVPALASSALWEYLVPDKIGKILENTSVTSQNAAEVSSNANYITSKIRKILDSITESSRTIIREIGDSKITLGLYDAAGNDLGVLLLRVYNSKLTADEYKLGFNKTSKPVVSGRAYISELPGTNLAGITLYKPGLLGGYLAKKPIFGFTIDKNDLKANGVVGAVASVVGLDNQTSYKEGGNVIPFDKVKHIIVFSGAVKPDEASNLKTMLLHYKGTDPLTEINSKAKVRLIDKAGGNLAVVQLDIVKNVGTYKVMSPSGTAELLSGKVRASLAPGEYATGEYKVGILLDGPQGWTNYLSGGLLGNNSLFGFVASADALNGTGTRTTVPYKDIASWGDYVSGTKAVPFSSVVSVIIEK